MVTVIRGKQGAMQQLNIWELVVGDVVVLTAGDKVPADCIVISSQNLKVEEKYDFSFKPIKKDVESDPFLKADSFIIEGQARVLVACVGTHSTRGIIDEKHDLSSETPLQEKLFTLSKSF